MTLLRQIQNDAVSPDIDVATLLRKCMILAARLGHEPFEEWVDHELNGYPPEVALPGYRILKVQSQGNFSGEFRGLENVPIPTGCLPEKFRDTANREYLRKGVAAYATLLKGEGRASLRALWPSDLVAMMQQKIYEDMSCLAAWRVIPANALAAVLDTVTNRILAFVLELEKLAPDTGETKPGELPLSQEGVTNVFNVTVLGGTSVIASRSSDFSVAVQDDVRRGDVESLKAYLRGLGLEDEDLEELEAAIQQEEAPEEPGKFGPKVSAWMGKMTTKAASGAWEVGLAAAGTLLARALCTYFGLG